MKKNPPDTQPGDVHPDLRHMLYPFANLSYLSRHPPLVIERGEGVYVYDGNGKRYLDGQGGLWNVNVGHGRGFFIKFTGNQPWPVADSS